MSLVSTSKLSCFAKNADQSQMEDQAPPFDLLPNQNPISDRKDLFHYKKQKRGWGKERENKSIMA